MTYTYTYLFPSLWSAVSPFIVLHNAQPKLKPSLGPLHSSSKLPSNNTTHSCTLSVCFHITSSVFIHVLHCIGDNSNSISSDSAEQIKINWKHQLQLNNWKSLLYLVILDKLSFVQRFYDSFISINFMYKRIAQYTKYKSFTHSLADTKLRAWFSLAPVQEWQEKSDQKELWNKTGLSWLQNLNLIRIHAYFIIEELLKIPQETKTTIFWIFILTFLSNSWKSQLTSFFLFIQIPRQYSLQ